LKGKKKEVSHVAIANTKKKWEKVGGNCCIERGSKHK